MQQRVPPHTTPHRVFRTFLLAAACMETPATAVVYRASRCVASRACLSFERHTERVFCRVRGGEERGGFEHEWVEAGCVL